MARHQNRKTAGVGIKHQAADKVAAHGARIKYAACAHQASFFCGRAGRQRSARGARA